MFTFFILVVCLQFVNGQSPPPYNPFQLTASIQQYEPDLNRVSQVVQFKVYPTGCQTTTNVWTVYERQGDCVCILPIATGWISCWRVFCEAKGSTNYIYQEVYGGFGSTSPLGCPVNTLAGIFAPLEYSYFCYPPTFDAYFPTPQSCWSTPLGGVPDGSSFLQPTLSLPCGTEIDVASVEIQCVAPETLPLDPLPAGQHGFSNMSVLVRIYNNNNDPTHVHCDSTSPLNTWLWVPSNTCIQAPQNILSIAQSSTSYYVSCTGEHDVFVTERTDIHCTYPIPGHTGFISYFGELASCVSFHTLTGLPNGVTVDFDCRPTPVLPPAATGYENYLVQATFYAYSDSGGCDTSSVYTGPLLVTQGVCFTTSTLQSLRVSCQGDTSFVLPYNDAACTFVYGQVGPYSNNQCMKLSSTLGVEISCVSPLQLPHEDIPPLPPNTVPIDEPSFVIPSAYGLNTLEYEMYVGVPTGTCNTGSIHPVTGSLFQTQCLDLQNSLSVRIAFDSNGALQLHEFEDSTCTAYVRTLTPALLDSCISFETTAIVVSSRPAPPTPTLDRDHTTYIVAFQAFVGTDSACNTARTPEVSGAQDVCNVATSDTALRLYCDSAGNIIYRQMLADCTTYVAQGTAVTDTCTTLLGSNSRFKFACGQGWEKTLPPFSNITSLAYRTVPSFLFGYPVFFFDLTRTEMLVYVVPSIVAILVLPIGVFLLQFFRRGIVKAINKLLQKRSTIKQTDNSNQSPPTNLSRLFDVFRKKKNIAATQSKYLVSDNEHPPPLNPDSHHQPIIQSFIKKFKPNLHVFERTN